MNLVSSLATFSFRFYSETLRVFFRKQTLHHQRVKLRHHSASSPAFHTTHICHCLPGLLEITSTGHSETAHSFDVHCRYASYAWSHRSKLHFVVYNICTSNWTLEQAKKKFKESCTEAFLNKNYSDRFGKPLAQ